MPEERRYNDDEVAEIFGAATRTPATHRIAPAASQGLTLSELQAIGEEIEVDPQRIAEAASALDLRRNNLPRKTSLGMPVSVGRVLALPRAPSDAEWQLLLTELRTTFGAHGTDRSSGDLRTWTNGNLHAYIEPADSGYRLRLGTLKGEALAVNRLGIAGIGMALVLLLILLLTGELAGDVGGPVVLALLGAAALGYNFLRLPLWARAREEQMAYIAERAQTLLGQPAGRQGPHEVEPEPG